MKSPKPPFLVASTACYRILKRAYHDQFLEEFGEELDQTFRQMYREEFDRAGYFGLARLWIRVFRDTADSAVRSRISREERTMVPDNLQLSMNEVQARALQLQKKRRGAAVGAYGIELILVLLSIKALTVAPNLLEGVGVAFTIAAVSYQNWKRRCADRARPFLDMASVVDSYREVAGT